MLRNEKGSYGVNARVLHTKQNQHPSITKIVSCRAWRRPQPHKKALLKELFGESGLQQMLAVKRALDPEGKLAPNRQEKTPPAHLTQVYIVV
jgi:hypothetical protein